MGVIFLAEQQKVDLESELELEGVWSILVTVVAATVVFGFAALVFVVGMAVVVVVN